MKSWAIPKEPPTEAGTKRLAIQVEDHKLDYKDFEGTIPEGRYGAGVVNIWDRGDYVPIKIEQNELIFDLRGNRLKSTYCLIKLRPKFPKDRSWLFFKKSIADYTDD